MEISGREGALNNCCISGVSLLQGDYCERGGKGMFERGEGSWWSYP